jgi:hypothetical protein
MVLIFPDFETLRLALTTGAIPPAISRTAASSAVDERGQIHVQSSATFSHANLAELRRLGVKNPPTSEIVLTENVFCWPQLLPLRRGEPTAPRPKQTAVLFDLPAEELGAFATEILRLGNDRQSFRALEPKDASAGSAGRILLRVVGPPYYTLLRALDRTDLNGSGPLAYVECAPRVWVQFGYRHSLGERFKPSPGKVLFMRPPHQWTFLEDAPFRDIYEVLDFPLPDALATWCETEPAGRLRVPLRLTHSGGSETAELWVVRDDPIAQLDILVQSADDQLLARLAFAVGTANGQSIIVLRARPSKLPPPMLVLNAVACRAYLKLPNLFVPCGSRLHPPLRRDAVRKRLADDPGVVTWLYPQGDGGFIPESLPDQAFRPLSEWVDYVLEHEQQPLELWVQSTLFDFEPFVCVEEEPAKPKKPPAPERRRSGPSAPAKRARPSSAPRASPAVPSAGPEPAEEPVASFAPTEPTEARRQLAALEAEFLAVTGPLDAPERQAFWPRLAELNTGLGHDDAAVCWLHALWIPQAPTQEWASRWLRAEVDLTRQHEAAFGRGRMTLSPDRTGNVSDAALDGLLSTNDPTTAELRGLAACLLWAAQRRSPPPALIKRQSAIRHFLDTHDKLLPIRAAWLAWTSLATLAHGDVLAVARARDRLLERLYQNGLRPEQELPSFLRFGGQASGQRFRAIRDWLLKLRNLVARCCERMDAGRLIANDRSKTPACIDLIFAFGLARLGESEAASKLRERAQKLLADGEVFHQFLLGAYSYRIRQASEGSLPHGPLPDPLLAYLTTKEPSERHPYDRLRQISRMVEPHQRILWDQDLLAVSDPLSAELARLPKIIGRKQLAGQCRRLLAEYSSEPMPRARMLQTILEQCPRLGEDFASAALVQAVAAYDALSPAEDEKSLTIRADLLEKALFIAAHFDRSDQVQALIVRFQELLRSQRDGGPPLVFTSLVGQCLRGLRKLGLHQEIELLLRQLEDVLLRGQKPESLSAESLSKDGDSLPALLHLAAGWYDFGKDQQAQHVLDRARAVLLSGPLPVGTLPIHRAELACAYVATLAHAPLEFAQKRIVELFEKLESVATSWVTTPGYCALQVKLAEAVVLAVVSDDFTQGAELRRWLDEDEYLVRKRIHEDMRVAMAQA